MANHKNAKPLIGALLGIGVGVAIGVGTSSVGVGIGVGTGLAIIFGGGAASMDRVKPSK